MAARLSAKKLLRYSLEFKRSAVNLTHVPGVEVQVVAEALDIHPVMLSRWRQEAREGRLRGAVPRPKVLRIVKPSKRELKQLQALRRAHALLQEEHALLKKAIRFCSARRQRSLPSSRRSRTGSAYRHSASAMV